MPCHLKKNKATGRMEVNADYHQEKIQEDLDFGLPAEEAVIDRLSKHFKESITAMPKGWGYDAESKQARYEIKTRKGVGFDTYETQIIPHHKLRHKTRGKELTFVFNLTDGIYYINYEQEQFNKYEDEFIGASRSENGVALWNRVLHIHIPKGDLKLLR